MTIRPIVRYPDPRLAVPAQPVTVFDGALRELAQDLLETMHAAPGIGIAAPHIGIPLRVVVLDLDANDGARTYVNPEIIWASPEMIMHSEGSVSMPGVHDDIRRHARVRIGYRDVHGHAQTEESDGLRAVCHQHEIDQLNGLFWIFARPRPVGVRGDHQTARAIDEDALAEYSPRRHRPVVIGPPLEAVALAGNADVLLLGRGLGEPVGRHNLLVPGGAIGEHEQAKAGKVTRGRLNAAAGDFVPGLSLQPGRLGLHPGGLPDFFLQILRERLAGGGRDQHAYQVGLARVVAPYLARLVRARQLAHVADGGVHARIGPRAIEAGNVRVHVFVVFVPSDPGAHGQQLADRHVVIGRAPQVRDILADLVLETFDRPVLDRCADERRAKGFCNREAGPAARGVEVETVAFEADLAVLQDHDARRVLPGEILVQARDRQRPA